MDFFNRQPSSFNATLDITNVSPAVWYGWTATLTVTPAAHVVSGWGATYSGDGPTTTVTPDSYRQVLDRGKVAFMGMESLSPGLDAQVTAVTVDGHVCTPAP